MLGEICEKRYRMVGDKGQEVLKELRNFLAGQERLYRETVIRNKSGGRHGDLGEEVMEYEIYTYGSENGWNEGVVHVYSVIDSAFNGYGQHISVLVELPPDKPVHNLVLDYLQDKHFVSSYLSFRDRVSGHHHFRTYLNAVPDLGSLQEAFSHRSNMAVDG